jgi:hypothetical protein
MPLDPISWGATPWDAMPWDGMSQQSALLHIGEDVMGLNVLMRLADGTA